MRLERQIAVRHHVGTSAERRRWVRVTAQVTLWRVIAAAMFVPVVMVAFGDWTCEPAPDMRTVVKAFAYEAFPQWAIVHHEERCPQSIRDLAEYVGRNNLTRDSWGTELDLRCGDGIRGALVRSAGPDGRFDTVDDISSND